MPMPMELFGGCLLPQEKKAINRRRVRSLLGTGNRRMQEKVRSCLTLGNITWHSAVLFAATELPHLSSSYQSARWLDPVFQSTTGTPRIREPRHRWELSQGRTSFPFPANVDP